MSPGTQVEGSLQDIYLGLELLGYNDLCIFNFIVLFLRVPFFILLIEVKFI